MMKRILAFILSALFLFGTLPQALAEDTTTGFDGAKSFLIDELLAGKAEIDLEKYQIPTTSFVNSNGKIASDFQMFLISNSVIFHVEKYEASRIDSNNSKVTKLYPNYTMDEPELSQTLLLYNEELNRALSVVKPEMNRIEKSLALHDYMALNYEYWNTTSSTQKEAKMETLVLTKRGNCFAYTRTYEYLMNKVGVPCSRALSDEMMHIWNVAQMDDGNWYHIDVTWDDPVPDIIGFVSHRYFLLSLSEISAREHSASDIQCSYNANSKAYDDSPWKNVTSQIITHNGLWYMLDASYKNEGNKFSSGAVFTWDPKNQTPKANLFFETNTPWMDSGKNIYWSVIYSGLGKYDNKLFYQSMDTVYSVNLPTDNEENEIGTPVPWFMVDDTLEFYYGMYIEDNTLTYTTGTYYTLTSGRHTYDLSNKEGKTISYDANGGDTAPNSQIKAFGETLNLSTEVPTRNGYEFLGWAMEPEGQVKFQPGDSFLYEQNQVFLCYLASKQSGN